MLGNLYKNVTEVWDNIPGAHGTFKKHLSTNVWLHDNNRNGSWNWFDMF